MTDWAICHQMEAEGAGRLPTVPPYVTSNIGSPYPLDGACRAGRLAFYAQEFDVDHARYSPNWNPRSKNRRLSIAFAKSGMEPELRPALRAIIIIRVSQRRVTQWCTHAEGGKITSLARGWAVFLVLRTEGSVSLSSF